MGNSASKRAAAVAAVTRRSSSQSSRSSRTVRSSSSSRSSNNTPKDYRGTLCVESRGAWKEIPDEKIDEDMQQHILNKLETYIESYPKKNRDYSVRSNVPAGLIYVICDKPAPLTFTKDKKNYKITWLAVAL